MGKSKSGGTRGYIRGRIANDVYSIGKDGKGKKQQVIRSLAESVANPRTTAQMRGRMFMSTVMQAVAGLSFIVDHSFDAYPNGQPSISEFIRQNYALVKADALAHPSSGNKFGLNKYQEKGIKQGKYVLADGKAEKPSAIFCNDNYNGIDIEISGETYTIGQLKSQLGWGDDDYCTVVAIASDGSIEYARLRVNPALADTTVISNANVDTVFVLDANFTPTWAFSDGYIHLQFYVASGNIGIIWTEKTTEGFEHSKTTMELASDVTPTYNSDAALPTYPVGSENFLNGGDI